MFRIRCPQPQPTPPASSPQRPTRERAQATIELIGTLPIVLLAMLICLQAMLCGCALLCAQIAADRAARGLPRAEVLERLPVAWRSHARITRDEQIVRVTVRPPAVLPGVARSLEIRAASPRVTS